jgi:hypothetical protein
MDYRDMDLTLSEAERIVIIEAMEFRLLCNEEALGDNEGEEDKRSDTKNLMLESLFIESLLEKFRELPFRGLQHES